jgi:hypothetical protein
MSILAETPTIIQQLEDASSRLVLDETITELQIEMKSAVALAGEIKSENDDMKRQLESANAFSNANLQRHAEWKEVWKKEREVVLMREKQLERDEAKWKTKLEERRKEMDEMDKKKMNSNGAGVGGGAGFLDLVNEIQVEHANKTEKLTNEVSKKSSGLNSGFQNPLFIINHNLSHHSSALGNQVERTMLWIS